MKHGIKGGTTDEAFMLLQEQFVPVGERSSRLWVALLHAHRNLYSTLMERKHRKHVIGLL